ncbi:MAG: hypothetical protein F4122_06325, partial [Gammaproteobacteria bacterium]|nr:hypothetical protein [Gammaproteobacteria bacterium]
VQYRELSSASKALYNKTDERGHYQLVPLLVSGSRSGETGTAWRGIDPNSRGKNGMHWVTTPDKLDQYERENRVFWPEKEGGVPRLKYYLEDSPGAPVSDFWHDISLISPQSSESIGYPTQKPIELLRRIIGASSDEGDMVLDPFCGCATTCVAAESEGREWAGIDISPKAAELVKLRTQKELGGLFEGIVREDVPARDDIRAIRKYNHPDNKKSLYGEQGGHCNGCKTHFKLQNLTIDHITPRSKGGTDHLTNLQLLCGHCNSVKGDRGQEYLVAKLAA